MFTDRRERTTCGRGILCLIMALKVSCSIKADDVIDTLCELFSAHGVPNHISSDNGPEFIAKAIGKWLSQTDVSALYVEPGSPWQNGYSERFNSKFRDEFLNVEEFESVRDAVQMTKVFHRQYNEVRPHSALDYQTPNEFAAVQPSSSSSTDGGRPDHLECLHKQRLHVFEVIFAEIADGAKVRNVFAHDDSKGHVFATTRLNLPRRRHAFAITIQQQSHHHPRMKRRLAGDGILIPLEERCELHLANNVAQKVNQMVIAEPVTRRRRQKPRLIGRPVPKFLAHP